MKNLLEFYNITNYKKQILNYKQNYYSFFKDKILNSSELQQCLIDGFYIGQNKCRLGDYLSYTSVPFHLKKRWSDCKVFIAKHKFAQDVFGKNPYVDGILDFKNRKPIGSFREFGFGNTSQRRLRIFDIFLLNPVKPILYLEKKWIDYYKIWREKLPLNNKKLILVQSTGKTVKKLLTKKKWKKIIQTFEDKYYFVQIGHPRDTSIPVHKRKLKRYKLQELFGLFKQADIFIGPNSGLMHVAAGLDIPAIIIHNDINPDELFLPVLGDNLGLPKKIHHQLFHLYPWHYHMIITDKEINNTKTPYPIKFDLETLSKTLEKISIEKYSELYSKFLLMS